MPTITGHITDSAGSPDSRPWTFTPLGWRTNDQGFIVTTRDVVATPVNGDLTVFLEPGPVLAKAGKHAYTIVVPDHDVDILALLGAHVPVPSGFGPTLGEAVNRYLADNPPAGEPNAVTGSDAGTPTGLILWKGSQADYDAIPVKDDTTVYLVVEE